jgi:hypothetical protein
MINIILIILILITSSFLFNKKPDENEDNEILLNESFLNNPHAIYCQFTYDDINKEYEKNIKIINDDKKNNFINYNMIKSWQPNIYYDNDSKTMKKFNNSDKVLNNNTIIYSQNDDISTQDKTIREVYDSKIMDFKKNIPKKSINNNNIIKCASNLNVISPKEWNYDEEKPENGGEINNGLFAYDPLINQSVALC